MKDALTAFGTRRTRQSAKADDRQVPNSAGGFTFATGRTARLHRFLTLGTDGGTYYVSERDITARNAGIVLGWAREAAAELVREATAISQAGRAPRNNPALFALAAAASLGDEPGRRAALDALPLVARTGTHLFLFARYVQQFRGWGRGLLRLSHPAGSGAHRALFDFICGREAGLAELPLVEAFVQAQAATQPAQWVNLIRNHPALSWEMLPDAALSSPRVWMALLDNGMPQTALMRQLPRLTRLGVLGHRGVLGRASATTAAVAAQLADPEWLARARVHPVSVLLALRTYASGHGARGRETWRPVSQITDALDAAFYAAFGAVEPAGKRTMLALDVSGSMTQAVSGLPLSCREASAALALVTASTEPAAFVAAFTSARSRGAAGISPLDISPRQRLDDAIRKVSDLPFGGTDCALPMVWALRQKMEIDHFCVYADNETWAGTIHPHQALAEYRRKTGIPARLSVVGMTATDFTIADPEDPGTLDVAGFDSAVPSLLSGFARGDI
jgi:60 kDa SS-A/Ro ribonucleoprotein